jgi:arachidonate 15-lipoxygenase
MQRYSRAMAIPMLPADDPTPSERATRLSRRRDEYRWTYTQLPPLATVERVPHADQPSVRWALTVIDLVLKVIENDYAVAVDDRLAAQRFDLAHEAARLYHEFDRAGLDHFLRGVVFALVEGPGHRRPATRDDYAALFKAIPLPTIAADYRSDAVFARLRLAGANPLVICRLDALDSRLPVTDAMLAAATGTPSDGMARAVAEGRVFLADYSVLAGLPLGSFPDGPKYASPALALFALPPRGALSRPLMPVAIQLTQTPPGPLFTPRDGLGWELAKSIVSTADAIVHETIAHLGRTHLMLEPIVVAARRQLDEHHPLMVLLAPHFEGTLFINNAAHEILLSAGGPVDALLPFTIEATRALAAQHSATPSFNESAPRALLRLRGVDDAELLPDYPYRDDALLLWDAIHDWVAAYLAIYYTSDEAVRSDPELQAWIAELTANEGGRMPGIGERTSTGQPIIATRSYLVEAVTLIIFTASVQHAAVNAPQSPLMSFAPAASLARYAPAPTRRNDITESDYLAQLPSLATAQTQLNVNFVLGSMRYTTLGHYSFFHFHDARVKEPLSRFQNALRDIEAKIETRNQQRIPYAYLLPSSIPQSINS